VARSTTTTSDSPDADDPTSPVRLRVPGRPGSGTIAAMTVIRRGGQQDVAFMRSLLTHAYGWHANLLERDVPIGRYVDGWGRPGDAALVAMEGGHRIGAGWYRLFRESAPGYAFVDEHTPEVTVVVVPSKQEHGIGQLLLRGLIERAQAEAYRALSVSVERGNRAIAFFESNGFELARETENALILRRPLA
jgi:GNAT superfamily N-acetyltransferase